MSDAEVEPDELPEWSDDDPRCAYCWEVCDVWPCASCQGCGRCCECGHKDEDPSW